MLRIDLISQAKPDSFPYARRFSGRVGEASFQPCAEIFSPLGSIKKVLFVGRGLFTCDGIFLFDKAD